MNTGLPKKGKSLIKYRKKSGKMGGQKKRGKKEKRKEGSKN